LDLVKVDSETHGVNWKEFEETGSSDADISEYPSTPDPMIMAC
jgi:hypothetical protein